ncbi:hypothetical protein RRF57_000131 [Xylaria bambusicola]|uniref:Uncharacterized protein n=1 Tax=Xylaria bambusicola TaxID=326684 RepID=A0AAN7U3A4_9PEZI
MSVPLDSTVSVSRPHFSDAMHVSAFLADDAETRDEDEIWLHSASGRLLLHCNRLSTSTEDGIDHDIP